MRADHRVVRLVHVATGWPDGCLDGLVGRSVSVLRTHPPEPSTVARRLTRFDADRPQHCLLQAAVEADPLGLDPGGDQSCGIPGATLTTAAPVSTSLDEGPRWRVRAGSKIRPAAPRRAGSSEARRRTSTGLASIASPATTHRRPALRRVEVGLGDRRRHRVELHPGHASPARANASRSDPMPHPRSTHRRRSARSRARRPGGPGARRRPRWVACSSPSAVKYSRAAADPNFGARPRRRSTWVSAAATWSGSIVAAQPAETASALLPS